MSCGAKFYDLARDPAFCPERGATYQAAAPSRISAPAIARSIPAQVADDADDVDEKGPEIVALDEDEAAEDEADPTPADASGEGGDMAGGDTFLEEEDAGDDDVAHLIDGDLENDEER